MTAVGTSSNEPEMSCEQLLFPTLYSTFVLNLSGRRMKYTDNKMATK